MKTFVSFILSALCIATLGTTAWGQIPLPSAGFVEIDFNSFMGSGFAPTPAAGQLDSDTWRVIGLSDSAGTFGGTDTLGDFARGTSTGGVGTGGVYAFEVSLGDFTLGVQPTGGDFTSGDMTLKIQNNTGGQLTKLNLSYNIYVYNDQGRSNSFDLSYSTDDTSYTDVSGLDFTSPEAADASPSWISTNRTTSIEGLSVSDGNFIYLKWTGNDVSGSGSRDEFALDNVVLSAEDQPVPVQISSFTGTYINANSVQLDWATISEVNNYGFFVERRRANDNTFVELANSFIPGHGTTLIPHHYTYTDNLANGELWYYRLRQVDLDGSVHYTDQILVSTVTSVSHEVPAEFNLHQNYPNPFNPSTIIRFSVETQGLATLTLYNLLGQEITTLFSGTAGPQQLYSVRLDGSTLPTGTYFYRLENGDRTSLKKMILSK
ncbi:MAG: T9SS type A sorting domain-containing protein [Ignavibacteria bacterium]|nr:T9SS type A sorting domain-containing protein [Ignavibacteria bacterium]